MSLELNTSVACAPVNIHLLAGGLRRQGYEVRLENDLLEARTIFSIRKWFLEGEILFLIESFKVQQKEDKCAVRIKLRSTVVYFCALIFLLFYCFAIQKIPDEEGMLIEFTIGFAFCVAIGIFIVLFASISSIKRAVRLADK